MYDTLYIKLPYSRVTDIKPISEMPLFILKGSKHYYNGDGVFTGMYDCFYMHYPNAVHDKDKVTVFVKRDEYEIHLSLGKLFFGNNIQTLSLIEARMAMNALGDAIGVGKDIYKGNVTRCDFSSVICTDLSPSYYFNLLDELRGFNRSKQSDQTTLYYHRSQKDKKVKVYDKTKHAQDTNMKIPEEYEGEFLFRFEVVYYTKELNRIFKTKRHSDGVTVEDILRERAYIHFADYWLKYYNNIMKLNDANTMIQTHENQDLKANDIFERVVARLINQTGIEEAFKFVELDYLAGNVSDRRRVNDAKAKVRRVARSIPANPYHLIDELNTKMAERAAEIKRTIMLNERN